MIRDFFTAEQLGPAYSELKNDLRLGTPTAVYGVSAPHKCLIAPLSWEGRFVYITDNALSAASCAAQIAGFTGEEPALLTAKDEVLLYKDAVSKDALFKRINALYKIQNGARVVVCDIESLLQLFPRRLESLALVVGEEVDFSSLPEKLVKMGYTRAAAVESKGTFALRGDILDIFPVNAENPARVDFFGDGVEKIKPYNFVTGERLAQAEFLDIVAATDVTIEEGEVSEIKDVLFDELSRIRDARAYERAQTIVRELCAKLETGASFAGASFFLPLLACGVDFFNFLGGDALFVYDESKLVYDKLEAIYKEHEERLANLMLGGEAFSFSRYQLADKQDFLAELAARRSLALQAFASRSYFFLARGQVSQRVRQPRHRPEKLARRRLPRHALLRQFLPRAENARNAVRRVYRRFRSARKTVRVQGRRSAAIGTRARAHSAREQTRRHRDGRSVHEIARIQAHPQKEKRSVYLSGDRRLRRARNARRGQDRRHEKDRDDGRHKGIHRPRIPRGGTFCTCPSSRWTFSPNIWARTARL